MIEAEDVSTAPDGAAPLEQEMVVFRGAVQGGGRLMVDGLEPS